MKEKIFGSKPVENIKYFNGIGGELVCDDCKKVIPENENVYAIPGYTRCEKCHRSKK